MALRSSCSEREYVLVFGLVDADFEGVAGLVGKGKILEGVDVENYR
jgi:hypothetical protein